MNTKILVVLIILSFPLLMLGAGDFSNENMSPQTPNCLSFVFIPSNYNGYALSCPDAEDGVLTINAFGGVPPFSYLWEDGSTSLQRNNLGSGTYSVTVSDANGCELSSSITLQGPPAISISQNIINEVSCIDANDGILAAMVSGGAPPYSYEWENGEQTLTANNLTCGTHSVTVTDANSCFASANLIMGCPAVMQVNIIPTSNYGGFNLSCPESSDGVVGLSIQSGLPPFQYTWSTGATNANASNLVAGINSVTVTDFKGCSTIAFVEMTAPPTMQLAPNIISDYEGAAVSCDNATDGEVSVDIINGNAPYFFNWENGATQSHVTTLS
ncbi:MAG TPA: hypothetical protein ENJ53_02925, partial [Phaeodactylibacter sp.]|nr:hypothetical protein [Phaeodactylibacter sp.]